MADLGPSHEQYINVRFLDGHGLYSIYPIYSIILGIHSKTHAGVGSVLCPAHVHFPRGKYSFSVCRSKCRQPRLVDLRDHLPETQSVSRHFHSTG
jgi:hypothetical protein